MSKIKKAVIVPETELPEVEMKAVIVPEAEMETELPEAEITEVQHLIWVTNADNNTIDCDIFISSSGDVTINNKRDGGIVVICVQGDKLFTAESMNKCEFVIREFIRKFPHFKTIDGDAKCGMKQFRNILA